jgi:ribonuclease BN (tRNA processing enzyme)
MKIRFLGTKGYIKPSSNLHRMHTSTLFSYKKKNLLIDFGESWKITDLKKISPNCIFLTHAHPDHAFGLKEGTNIPVYATKKTQAILKKYPLNWKTILINKPIKIGSFTIEAFTVVHSIHCPAVGYKISDGKKSVFYVPDVVWIKNKNRALDVDLYIGDGATLFRNMIRKSKTTNEIFGHATIRQQLTWCKKHHIPKMIITHCGSDIVKQEKTAKSLIRDYAKERNSSAIIAYDGMSYQL